MICIRVGEDCWTEKRTEVLGKWAGGGSWTSGGEGGCMTAKSLGSLTRDLSTSETERYLEREECEVARDLVEIVG